MATVEDLPVIDKILSRLGSSKSYKANSTARVGSIEWRTKTNDLPMRAEVSPQE
jgi:hypothetical protein